MQAVVYIPKVYENEKELKLIFNPKNKSITYVSMNDCCYEEFACTVLPKGHGRLIDADALRCENTDFDTYNDYCTMFDEVDVAETIIEADKEKGDKNDDN